MTKSPAKPGELKINLVKLREYLKQIGIDSIKPGDYAEIAGNSLFMRNLKAETYSKIPFKVKGKNVKTILDSGALSCLLDDERIVKVTLSSQDSVEELDRTRVPLDERVNSYSQGEINKLIKLCPYRSMSPEDVVISEAEVYCCKDKEQGEIKQRQNCVTCLEDRMNDSDNIYPRI